MTWGAILALGTRVMRVPVRTALVLTTALIGTNGARADDDATVFLGWPDTGPAFVPLEEAPRTFLYDAVTLPAGRLAPPKRRSRGGAA